MPRTHPTVPRTQPATSGTNPATISPPRKSELVQELLPKLVHNQLCVAPQLLDADAVQEGCECAEEEQVAVDHGLHSRALDLESEDGVRTDPHQFHCGTRPSLRPSSCLRKNLIPETEVFKCRGRVAMKVRDCCCERRGCCAPCKLSPMHRTSIPVEMRDPDCSPYVVKEGRVASCQAPDSSPRTLMATSAPVSLSCARYTCPRLAAATGSGLILLNTSWRGRPKLLLNHLRGHLRISTQPSGTARMPAPRSCHPAHWRTEPHTLAMELAGRL